MHLEGQERSSRPEASGQARGRCETLGKCFQLSGSHWSAGRLLIYLSEREGGGGNHK